MPVAVARSERGEEVGEVRAGGIRRVGVPLVEEGAELEQVGAVGGERVARQPALELEVGEEVEDERLEVAEGPASGASGAWAVPVI